MVHWHPIWITNPVGANPEWAADGEQTTFADAQKAIASHLATGLGSSAEADAVFNEVIARVNSTPESLPWAWHATGLMLAIMPCNQPPEGDCIEGLKDSALLPLIQAHIAWINSQFVVEDLRRVLIGLRNLN